MRDVGFYVNSRLLDTTDFGSCQQRERYYIVAVRRSAYDSGIADTEIDTLCSELYAISQRNRKPQSFEHDVWLPETDMLIRDYHAQLCEEVQTQLAHTLSRSQAHLQCLAHLRMRMW